MNKIYNKPKDFNDVVEYILDYIQTLSIQSKREKYIELKKFVDASISFLRTDCEDNLSTLKNNLPILLYYSKLSPAKRKTYAKTMWLKKYMEEHFNLDTECWFIKDLYKDM